MKQSPTNFINEFLTVVKWDMPSFENQIGLQCVYSFIHSLIHSFIHSLTHSLCSSLCLFVYLSIYLSMIPWFVPQFYEISASSRYLGQPYFQCHFLMIDCAPKGTQVPNVTKHSTHPSCLDIVAAVNKNGTYNGKSGLRTVSLAQLLQFIENLYVN